MCVRLSEMPACFATNILTCSLSGPGGHLRDGAAAPRLHDEDGELPEAPGAEERPDRHRQPRHPRQGSSICIYLFGEREDTLMLMFSLFLAR